MENTNEGSPNPNPSELTTAIAKLNLDEATAVALKDAFLPFEIQANEWKQKAEQLTVTDVSETDKMRDARTARLALVKIRTGVTNLHKEKKADILQQGRTLDLIKNTLVGLIEPIEETLEKSEKFLENKVAEERAALRKSRLDQIAALNDTEAIGYDKMPLEDMPADAFETVLIGIKARKEQRESEAKENARIKAENEENARKENERIRQENESLRMKQDRLKRRIQRMSGIGLQWIDPTQYKRTEGDNLNLPSVKGYHAWLGTHWISIDGDIETMSDEDFEKDITTAEPLIRGYFAEKQKTDAENKAKAEKAELDRKNQLAAERKAKRAPDKVKLEALAKQFEEMELPKMREDDTTEIINNVRVLTNKIAKYIKQQCDNL